VALDARTGQRVALKTLTAASAASLVGIRREIAALRQLDHPGVVRVIDDGVAGGVPWFAMELHAGETVGAHMRKMRAMGHEPTLTSAGEMAAPTLVEEPMWTRRLADLSG